MTYFLTDLVVKMIGRFRTDNPEIKYKPSKTQRVLFWISLSMFLSYLI